MLISNNCGLHKILLIRIWLFTRPNGTPLFLTVPVRCQLNIRRKTPEDIETYLKRLVAPPQVDDLLPVNVGVGAVTNYLLTGAKGMFSHSECSADPSV